MKSSALAAALVAQLGLDKKPEDVTAAIDGVLAADKAKVAADKAAADKSAEDKAAADKVAADKKAADEKEADDKARDEAAKKAGRKPEEMVKGEDGNWGLGGRKATDEDPYIEATDGGVSATVGAGSIANTIGKPAMDAAIKTAVDAALAADRALYAAREEVKPVLGNVTTFDTADAVYGAALDHLKIEHKDVHPSAWRALFQAATKQGAAPAIVGDAKPAKSMSESIPHLNRLGR